MRCSKSLAILVVLLSTFAAFQVAAQVVPERSSSVAEKEYRHPDLYIRNGFQRTNQLPAQAALQAQQRLETLGIADEAARVDRRTGRFGTLMPSVPMVPGQGVGNNLQWKRAVGPPADDTAYANAARAAFRGYLEDNAQALGLDPAEVGHLRATVREGGALIQLYAPRLVDGVPVRSSYLTGVISHGNLVLFGANNWGDVQVSRRPTLSEDAALEAASEFLVPNVPDGFQKGRLELVPLSRGGQDVDQVAPGQGLSHRLVWTLRPQFSGDQGSWELLVDAASGEVLAFEDTNHYATPRQVTGGVYPITNDGINPDGVEQAGWPMPYSDVTNGGNGFVTDSGGNLVACVDGNVTSTLCGQYVCMNDNCGSIGVTSAGDIDFGTSGGTDCTTPGTGGAGNTHASRSGFFELNRVAEQARGWLPDNVWLQQQLVSNMNINSTCNAFWNGVTVNFYRSGGGCNNTGEIAGVFVHEWGHGMDDNDVNPSISNPGEGIADVYTHLRLNVSCIGRNFRQSGNCGGYGDPCLDCSGVRDIDWAKRQSGQPHDVAFTDAACGSGGGTPCGGSTHCEGATYSEAVYDLNKRDLAAAGYDSNTAHELSTRLTYLGAGPVGTWYQCVIGFGGCNADGGYLNYLAADDDNGNLNDGTPHMQAIFDAFDRHGIACGSPTVQNGGCAGTPTQAPNVVATPFDRGVQLTWGAVPGATKYQVFRADGVFACDFGKVRLGETTGTSWVDSGLQNGHSYSYIVIPTAGPDTCMGPSNACVTTAPVAGGNVEIDTGSASVAFSAGDGDVFLDNCESATMSFDVLNIGNGAASNVRIVSVTPSNPGVQVTTSLPSTVSASLAQCGIAQGSFDFTAEGLSHNEVLTFAVEITSDELSPITKTTNLVVTGTESDFQSFASKTFTFDADTEGWEVVQGTWGRTNATHTSFYEASSDNLPDQCDQVRSPVIRLSSTSTLSLQNRFDIEPFFNQGQVWYDRANVGIYDTTDGSRTLVSPDGGRTYNASGPNGTCGTEGQAGWAAAATSFASSSWSSAALGSAAFSGVPVRLDVRYGTDAAAQGFGLHFDDVTLTNVDLQVPDGNSDTCVPAVCGNGVREGSEECDGADLGSASCQDFGCGSGSLSCNGDCTLNSTACGDCSVCGNGTCEQFEDCVSCPSDCPSFDVSGATCGNGVCEAGDGEDCVSCPADCNGVQGGKPNGRFCCGDGDGDTPVSCSDSRCTTGGFDCTDVPVGGGVTTCCGDLTCESPEDGLNCALDCGAPPMCGDGTCDPGEDSCSCSADCGAPASDEVGLCTDGMDNDCDLAVDCADSDCAADAACQAVDCSAITDKNVCNAEATCQWDNRAKVCVAI